MSPARRYLGALALGAGLVLGGAGSALAQAAPMPEPTPTPTPAPGATAQPAPQPVAPETLADIRRDLTTLALDIARLKRELAPGAPGAAAPGLAEPAPVSGPLARLDAIESEVRRLTALSEELEFQIGQIVADGTRRLGDLEFRLVELEGGDISALSDPLSLGGAALEGAGTPVIAPPAPMGGPGAQLALRERDDFETARAAFENGNAQEAATRLAAFTQTYPGGPLSAEAHFLRGEALSQLEQTAEAARAYLQSFSAAPEGARASLALLRLGERLSVLGQAREACITFGEVESRYPGTPEAGAARALREGPGCPE